MLFIPSNVIITAFSGGSEKLHAHVHVRLQPESNFRSFLANIFDIPI